MNLQSADHSEGLGALMRVSLAALLLGSLLVGIAQIALLPPFEGADELAHYSYIQQIAEAGRWPALGDPMSADIDRYWIIGPLPKATGSPLTYRSFFESSADTVNTARTYIHDPRDGTHGWSPGRQENWQAQHPPLYYALASPLYLATKGWSLINQLIALRLFSYLIAWSALVIAVATALRVRGFAPHARTALALAPALWPALFPGWFPEMARLGNDSLVALIAALSWIVLIRVDNEPGRMLNYLLLGVFCGLGMLAKAIMAPFAGVVAAYLLFRAWARPRSRALDRAQLVPLALFCAALFLVSGWWYLLSLYHTGNVLGSIDGFRLDAAGGLMQGLKEHGNVRAFLLALLMTLLTFLWAGSWSFVMPALLLYAPMIILLVLLAVGWRIATRERRGALELVPMATLAIFGAALVRHAFVLIALAGAGFAGGWYLHAMMPILASALGLAIAGAMAKRALRPLTIAAMIFPVFFLIFAMIGQVLFYAGCGVQRPSLRDLIGRAPCGFDLATIFERLAVLAYPRPAMLLLVAGWLALLCGVICACATLRSSARVRWEAVGGD
jgi:hypothetical protein